jgi:CelD/BcsL family acetyltransferase involved in cellulose biosynthesis
VSAATAPVSTSSLEVVRMGLSEALALGPQVWEAVEAKAESPSPFMSWAWHRAWADAAPAADAAASEVLILRDSDGVVRSLLPVLLRQVSFHRVAVNALSWAVGDVGCPDHLDVLAMQATPMAPLAASLEAMPWEVLILNNLAPTATATRRLCEELTDRGCIVRRQELWTCPYLELQSDWDAYLGTLTPTRRQTLRRKERQLRRQYAVTVTDYDGDRVADGLRHLMSLHESRWQGGAFQAPGMPELHRRFAAELAARGQLWLSTLDVDGAPVAAWYGFTWGDTVYFYQSGRDPGWERHSVGLILMGTMIRRAIERGYRRFDFLRGADPYKRQWTSTQCVTEEITVFRRGWRGKWLRSLNALAGLRGRLGKKADG